MQTHFCPCSDISYFMLIMLLSLGVKGLKEHFYYWGKYKKVMENIIIGTQ